MKVNGVDCTLVLRDGKIIKKNSDNVFSIVPLNWLALLPERSGVTKVVVILWAYGKMSRREWFTISNRIFHRHGLTTRQKNVILANLAKSGAIETRQTSGKAIEIRLIKPQVDKSGEIPLETKKAVRKRETIFGINCCEDCGSREDLLFHHTCYSDMDAHGPYDVRGREKPEHLVQICKDCHKTRHTDVAGNYHPTEEEAGHNWGGY